MEHLINKNVKNIEISGIRQFFNMVAAFDDTISLTIGQPDFLTPAHVKNAAIEAIQENFTTYTHNAGYLELRKAAAHFLKKKYELDYHPESEIIVTTGASQAIDISFRAILDVGSEVILPGPVYPGYEPIISLCGAVPVHINTSEHDFRLTADLIKQHITEKTRCIILPYPSNPTGVTLDAEEIKKIADLIRGRDLFVLSDEIYSELVFNGKHESIAKHLRDQTIVINGLSKSHSMTGFRIGLLFAPAQIAKHLLKVHQYNVSCASSISQKAALAALNEGINDAFPMKTEYEKRMNYVYERLTKMGLPTVKPDGSFYIFPSIKKLNISSFDFAYSLAKDGGVAVVPGSAFSSYGEGYVRISYACSFKQLEEGLNRMEKHITTY
ncbi:aminotransferase A [Bacillus sp. UMB0893]|uniref:aminotransferase A n=1 Tax=Bacillus sp. UMB0893 TaxID=2066053 RepID=UPI000C75F791|nr:aminotransferase A [Bacillus sp. UMB0893]PLR69471.1 aromatic amino acid aminotransferase [Bacillus sp. UMB0893]